MAHQRRPREWWARIDPARTASENARLVGKHVMCVVYAAKRLGYELPKRPCAQYQSVLVAARIRSLLADGSDLEEVADLAREVAERLREYRRMRTRCRTRIGELLREKSSARVEEVEELLGEYVRLKTRARAKRRARKAERT